VVSGVDKPFLPDAGLIKGDLLAYYRDVAEVMRPPPARRRTAGSSGSRASARSPPSWPPAARSGDSRDDALGDETLEVDDITAA
jgi:hypothetical protein